MHFVISLCPLLPASVIAEALLALREVSQRSLAANVSALTSGEPLGLDPAFHPWQKHS